MQLWWDHLPSPEVLGRGASEEEAPRCIHCGRAGMGSTWHVLGECLAPRLVEARRVATKKVLETLREVTQGWETIRQAWIEELGLENNGTWRPPAGWSVEGGRKAGASAVPWYGTFPRA